MNKGEIYFNEFKDIFHNSEMYLEDDGIDLMYKFITDLLKVTEEDRIKALRRMQSDIEEYRENNEKCPECGGGMVVSAKQDNEKLEHFGTEYRQTVNMRKCPYCGWKDDD
ncbi:TPA: hypothetical protein PTV74_003202 [Clostridium botulinum]|nr:hypothetical protein [Clostridium botulinum]HDK7206357.1 hypothetical protein [Clostridium botulinum]HDK7210093.1 hypothetical protein [Clostridium botulinum]HDK7265542.1 hypothetical protein [Clostridium botulinum]HDK7269390.1 hypothetical protein [Clostridium botulinum]